MIPNIRLISLKKLREKKINADITKQEKRDFNIVRESTLTLNS
jgi:hypothetical protein